MNNYIKISSLQKKLTRNEKSENGLQNLAAYYQKIFDIEENLNYYSANDYQNAKRKFVKYLMNERAFYGSDAAHFRMEHIPGDYNSLKILEKVNSYGDDGSAKKGEKTGH